MLPDDELDARYEEWASDCHVALIMGVPRSKIMAMAERYMRDCQTIIQAAGLGFCRGCLQETGGDKSRSLIAIASVLEDRRALCHKHLKMIGINANGRWRG